MSRFTLTVLSFLLASTNAQFAGINISAVPTCAVSTYPALKIDRLIPFSKDASPTTQMRLQAAP